MAKHICFPKQGVAVGQTQPSIILISTWKRLKIIRRHRGKAGSSIGGRRQWDACSI